MDSNNNNSNNPTLSYPPMPNQPDPSATQPVPTMDPQQQTPGLPPSMANPAQSTINEVPSNFPAPPGMGTSDLSAGPQPTFSAPVAPPPTPDLNSGMQTPFSTPSDSTPSIPSYPTMTTPDSGLEQNNSSPTVMDQGAVPVMPTFTPEPSPVPSSASPVFPEQPAIGVSGDPGRMPLMQGSTSPDDNSNNLGSIAQTESSNPLSTTPSLPNDLSSVLGIPASPEQTTQTSASNPDIGGLSTSSNVSPGVESAPTDLSHLSIGIAPIESPSGPMANTMSMPTLNTGVNNQSATPGQSNGHVDMGAVGPDRRGGIPKIVVILLALILIVGVGGGVAYFVLGIGKEGDPSTTSLPAEQSPLTNPPQVVAPTVVPLDSTTSAGSAGSSAVDQSSSVGANTPAASGSANTSTGVSAIELLRKQRSATSTPTPVQ